jgi:hypothetical protein
LLKDGFASGFKINYTGPREVEIVGRIDKGASTAAPLIIDIYDNRYPANKWCQSIITLALLIKAFVQISIESV